MLGGLILKVLTGGVLDTIKDLGKAYLNKEISEEQYHSEIAKALASSSAQIETEIMKTSSDQFKEFQHTLRSEKLVQYCYAMTVVATLWTHFWFVWLQPFGVAVWETFPVLRTGDKVLEWNYFLLAGLFGVAPLVLASRAKGKYDDLLGWVKKRFKD